MTVGYRDASIDSVYIDNADVANVVVKDNDSTGNVRIKPVAADAGDDFVDSSSPVPDGSVAEYEFKITPDNFSIGGTASDGELFWGTGRDQALEQSQSQESGFDVVIPIGFTLELETEQITFVPDSGNDGYNIAGNVVIPANSDVEDLVDAIVEEINQTGGTYVHTYKGKNDGEVDGVCQVEVLDINNQDPADLGYNIGQTFDATQCEFEVTWKWTASKSLDSAQVEIKPYPSKIRWTKFSLSGFHEETPFNTGSAPLTLGIAETYQLQVLLKVAGLPFDATDSPNTYLDGEYFQLESKGVAPTFKAGASHKLGIVYYDKYGRHGFVNDLGQFYVESFQERAGLDGYGAR